MNLPLPTALFTPSWHAELELGYARFGDSTRPVQRRHKGPLRVQKHLYAEGPEVCQHIIVHPPGGIAGGDRLEVSVAWGEGADAVVTTQAAEKVYRADGAPATMAARLTIGAGATAHWLPQETILFDGARLERRMQARLAPGARLLAAEMLVYGRVARGEQLGHGALFDSWRLWRDGRLHWADAAELGGDIAATLRSPFGFGGAEASALLLLSAEAEVALSARDMLRQAGQDATLARPGLMLARWLGPASVVRESVALALPMLRAHSLGLPPRLPRLWTS